MAEVRHERSHGARSKANRKAKDESHKHDMLYEGWYDWLRTARRHNLESKKMIYHSRKDIAIKKGSAQKDREVDSRSKRS